MGCEGKEYRWSLRKGGRKERCPQCGKMRFVPFVLTADGKTPAGAEYGRCDREQHCGYFRYPGKEVAAPDTEWKREPEKAWMWWPKELADFDAPTERNTLWRAFAPLLGSDNLRQVMAEYRCGTGENGECIYWQFDGEKVRTGKAIMYDGSGHRVKDGLPAWWWHTSPGSGFDPERHEIRQCLFGVHRITEKTEVVFVLESEKSAVLMTATDRFLKVYPNVVYVACGGSQMLKGACDLNPLTRKGLEVTLFPDDGQYWNWKRTAEVYGWECRDIAREKSEHGLPDGCDIWDIFQEVLMRRKEAVK